MGFRANIIMVSENGGPVFATDLPHQPEKARTILARLGCDRCKHSETSNLSDALHLTDERIGVGAYDGGFILGGMAIDHPEKRSIRGLVDSLFQLYPRATILELGLHSVVNYFHYKLWESGKLIRHYAGTADDGVVAEVGAVLPEEAPYFADSEVRDGRRIFFSDFEGQREEHDVSVTGEELLFAVASGRLGMELDAWDRRKDFSMEIITPSRKPAFIYPRWWKFWRWRG